MNETARIALTALKTNKLRSALTMLGVAIGVFSVIGVMTALSVIATSIETGLSFLGSNLFQFAKYPVMNSSDPELKFANRRNISLAEALEYKRLMEGQAGKGSNFGQSQDDLMLVPITRYFSDFGWVNRTVNIATQSTSQATYNQTLDKAIGAMRAARGLKLGQDNDFAIYSNDTLVAAFAQVADTIRIGAFVVSASALLAAGIGIMNIM